MNRTTPIEMDFPSHTLWDVLLPHLLALSWTMRKGQERYAVLEVQLCTKLNTLLSDMPKSYTPYVNYLIRAEIFPLPLGLSD